ncbi:isocitrate/isopropylmalate dehydrogenase family protein [Halomonas sp. QX-2]|uniref:3-isopropylmalate dehydrogenase n=1 Tax=Vreelandella sedimenti TaxID=2729618 RepID=A0A7Z0SMK2_9GAMM|nr:isocitrate/isopropylmalate family dehydrogenase [Halomonas sedimenti]NYT73747.1 isocitrate/isopropylmalate dehydrogenase family protein [Halomonas sedimenti]
MADNSYNIAVLSGDGIGPEVIDSALKVLGAASEKHGINLLYQHYEAGAEYYEKNGESISMHTMESIGKAHAVLLGAMGLPHIRKSDGTEIAPQIDIREHYGLFASLRPVKLFEGVGAPLNSGKANMLVIRETTEGLFAGRHDKQEPSDETVSDRLTITRATSEKLFTLAFAQARARKKGGSEGRVTLFDKANVLRSNAFLRKIFYEVAEKNSDIEADHLYIDAAAMMMVQDPSRFDVIVTENVFGDIVSELGAGLVGGLGVAPSGDVSEEHGVFQPSHGTAPDIEGKNIANPVATVLSAAMMLDWLEMRNDDQKCKAAADEIRAVTEKLLAKGVKTADIGGNASSTDITQAYIQEIQSN